MRMRIGIILVFLGFLALILPLASSAAIEQLALQRTVAGNLTIGDLPSQDLIVLNGFDGKTYNLRNKYQTIGTITNNSGQDLEVVMTVTVNYTQSRKVSGIGYKFDGSTVLTFSKNDTKTSDSSVLQQGDTVNFSAAYLDSADIAATAKYTFEATSLDGNISTVLTDSDSTPIRHYFN